MLTIRLRICKIAFVGKKPINGIIAQLGEHLPYKQRVIGSSPIGSIFLGEVAQLARARGSYPRCREFESPPRYADVAQSVERRLGKAEVTSSILVISSYPETIMFRDFFISFFSLLKVA